MTAPMRQPLKPAVDAKDLRAALSKFATGVTVVTANSPRGPVGITVNSFSSVSLDPALVLWSLGKSSNRLAVFEEATDYAVHVMSGAQRDLCLGFTRDAQAFDPAGTTLSAKGVPLIENCLARFECTRHAVHEGGDHLIFVAQVEAVHTGEAAPLVFFNSGFGAFQAAV